jgi:hypothetical protein
MTRRVRATGAALLFAVALFAGASAPAFGAGSPTSIEFVTASPVEAAFGGNWTAELQTRYTDFGGAPPVVAGFATVDVMASGLAEPIATDLPIQPDGAVYLSAPATPLPPGEYQLTAILIPAAGEFVATSQTDTPLILRITAFDLTASATVDQAGVDAGQPPVVELTLSGEFVDTTGAVPAGTWQIVVDEGGQVIEQTEVGQPAGAPDPVRYPVAAQLDRGREYTVTVTFVPAEAVAPGITMTQPGAQTFRTRDDSLGDALAREIPYPWWLLVITGLVPLALAATVILLTVRLSRTPAAAGTQPVATQPVAPVDPAPDDIVPIEDLFPLQNAAVEPVDWSLAGSAEETPTELIDPEDPNHLR